MTLGEKILQIAHERDMTLKQVSQASGVPYNTLRAYTRPGSRTVPTAPNGIALAKSLGVSIEWLFDDTQGMPWAEYYEPPPAGCVLRPWPPRGIDWDGVQVALEFWRTEYENYFYNKVNEHLERLGVSLRIATPSRILHVRPLDQQTFLDERARQEAERAAQLFRATGSADIRLARPDPGQSQDR